MTRIQTLILAAGGSFGLLGGAFVFQLMGYAPCEICLWQRWPHAAAIVIGVILIAVPNRALALLGGIAAAITGGLGVYHTGIEQKWWAGPTSCTGPGDALAGLSGSDLLSFDNAAVVMCDEVAWWFMGLSMASWNAIISFGLVFLWFKVFQRT